MTSDASRHMEVFTIDLPPSPGGGSFAQYRANGAPTCDLELPPDANPSAFRFRSDLFHLADALLFRASSVEQLMRRTQAHVAANPDQMMLTAQVAGTVVGDYGGHPRVVGPGDVYLTDHACTYDIRVSDFVIVALIVARDRFARRLLSRDVHEVVLPAGSGDARLLGSTLQAMFDTAGALTQVELSAAVDGLCTTASGLFSAHLASATSRVVGDFGRVAAMIDARLGDPELSPSVLERELGLSRSRLYRLFEPHGGVGAFILARRLERGAALMLDGHHGRLTLRMLAERCGFRSEDHFGRAFRTRFGVTPRQFRDMVHRRDVDALRKLAQASNFEPHDNWIRDFGSAPEVEA